MGRELQVMTGKLETLSLEYKKAKDPRPDLTLCLFVCLFVSKGSKREGT